MIMTDIEREKKDFEDLEKKIKDTILKGYWDPVEVFERIIKKSPA